MHSSECFATHRGAILPAGEHDSRSMILNAWQALGGSIQPEEDLVNLTVKRNGQHAGYGLEFVSCKLRG